MLKKIGSTVLACAPLSVFAAVPDEVSAALADGKTDTMTVAGLSIVILIGVAVFKYMRRGV